LQEEVQYWKNVSRELRSVQSEDHEGFFKKQAKELRFQKEQLLWENHSFREMERVMRRGADILTAELKETQTRLDAANLSNSSMEEMLEQTKQKLTVAKQGDCAVLIKAQSDEIMDLRQKLEHQQQTQRAREELRATEMEAAAVAAEEQRADMVELRKKLSWSDAAKAVAVERACAAAQDQIADLHQKLGHAGAWCAELEDKREEAAQTIADLRQQLSWTEDQMDAALDKEMVSAAAETAEQEAEAVEKKLRDEIAELKAVLERIDMDHEIDAYMGRTPL
jgi:hypothetical protein